MAFPTISTYTTSKTPELERTAPLAQPIPTAQKAIAVVNNPSSSVTASDSQPLKRPREYVDVTPAAKRTKIENVSVDLSVKNATPIRDQGKITYANGNIYEGEFKDNKFHGKGKLTFANGNIYEGEFKDGKGHGKSKLTFVNRNIYEGEFKDSKPHGKGKFTFADGQTEEREYF